MARLPADLLDRVEDFAHRVVDVATTLGDQGRSRRVLDQMIGCGTSVAANMFEADEAMSRADFAKCLAIALKETNEARFWLRFTRRRGWIAADRLAPLEMEADELRRIFGSMLARVRKRDATLKP